MKNRHHSRETPQGRALGKSAARMADSGRAILKAQGLENLSLPALRDEMCNSCACQLCSVPNGCLQTQLDLLKVAVEGSPFLCHAPFDGRMCAGWARLRAHIVINPVPKAIADLLARHQISPPDEQAAASIGGAT